MADHQTPLPPCGVYRTTQPIGEVPAGRLVYFHNHGDPGPGIYTPHEWKGNKARFHDRGYTLSSPDEAKSLVPLAAEGFYRVVSSFYCCEKRCRQFEPDTLVQLGYDSAATPILFTPEFLDGIVALPEHGLKIDRDRIEKLACLKVATGSRPGTSDPDNLLH
jgi:hypothetical protein